MAANGEVVTNEELNFTFKSLGERGIEGERWKEYNEHVSSYVLQQLSELLSQTTDNHIRVRPYGSATEDLKCLADDDVGDVDIMIFPDSDNLMIYEELLEYSPENPLHVRIKGSNHPVLKSCLVEETEYVATSALKNFHSAIYGSLSPYLAEFVTRTFQLMSREDVSAMLQCTSHLKNSATSPAITLDFAQSFGSISEQLEWMKEPQNLPTMDPSAGWEWIAHYACTARGMEYTKQHAELVDEYLQFSNEVQKSLQEKGQLGIPQTFPVMFQELLWSDKALKLKSRLRDIESETQNETGTTLRTESGVTHNYHQQFVTPENRSDENERDRKEENSLRGTSPSNDGPNDTETNCWDGRRTSGDLESTVSPSAMQNNICHQQAASTPGAYDISEDKSNAEYKEDVTESHEERQPFAQKEELISLDQPPNPRDDENDEKRELERRVRNRWLDHLFGKETVEAKRAPSRETKFKYTETAQRHERIGGIDFVPAFRSRGWPKVARDWIKRERKWPSPGMVDKVIQEGYHLVVKPPKKSGNPDCDFRISFSHAEYLLSQEMNEIQRECYRCLKKFHRAHLSQPVGLVTFHLKNILLQTIEETSAELWTESNRAMSMMKLLGNLLEALTKKDLRHYFVRSYNLFGVDYIEDPDILESLAGKVKQIMENATEFSKKLIKDQEEANQAKREERVSNKQSVLSREPNLSASEHRNGGSEEISSKENNDIQCKEEKSALSVPKTETTTLRHHDLKEIFLDISNELIDMAFNDSNLRVDILDSLERSLVNDLREIVSNHDISIERLPKLFDICWDMAYYKVWISTEPDMRRRMLVGIQGQVEMWKYMLKQEDCEAGNEAAILDRMFDPSADNPFDLNHIMPADAMTQFLRRFVSSLEPRSAHPAQVVNLNDIPLD